MFSSLGVEVYFRPRVGAFYKFIILNLLKYPTLSARVPDASLNTDRGSTSAFLSTVSRLRSDQKSLDCVSSIISARNTLFSSCQLVWR